MTRGICFLFTSLSWEYETSCSSFYNSIPLIINLPLLVCLLTYFVFQVTQYCTYHLKLEIRCKAKYFTTERKNMEF